MNKLTFIILSAYLFFLPHTYAMEKKLQGSKNLPIELNSLIDSLNITDDTGNTPNQSILQSIKNIDFLAQSLNKEDVFLIGKIEIYKTLLKSNERSANPILDNDSLKKLQVAIKNTEDPFALWFLKSLLHDSKSIMTSNEFKEYLLQKNNGKIEKTELKKMNKKITLLSRWINLINPDTPEFNSTIKEILRPVQIECLKNIEIAFNLIVMETLSPQATNRESDKKSSKEMSYFSFKPIKITTENSQKTKTVEDIIAPLTDEESTQSLPLPAPSNENWLNDENAPTNLKNLPKPKDDTDWLQDF